MNKKSKVFVGLIDIAGSAVSIAKALRSVGVDATAYYLSNKTSPFKYETERLIKQISRKSNNVISKLFLNKITLPFFNFILRANSFFVILFQYDYFIFISRFTFFQNNFDLKILKLLKKKICFRFSGCLERNPKDILNMQEGGFCRICEDKKKQVHCYCDNIDQKRKKIQLLEVYADIIFTFRDTSGFLTQSKKQYVNYHPIEFKKKVNLDEKFSTDNIIVAHFPSNTNLKGTAYVEKAIKELKENNRAKFKYISNKVSNSEILDFLNQTHILIDQFTHYHGRLAVEAMASGCVVIGRISEWFLKERPELPIVNASTDNLKMIIEYLLNNKAEMKRIASLSIRYYQKYHTLESVGNYLKKSIML